MNSERIGQATDAIWWHLKIEGETSLRSLVERLHGARFDEPIIYAGIGWLAREGKLTFRQGFGTKILVSLIQEDPVV